MTPLSEEELVIARLLECIPNPRLDLVRKVVESHRSKLQAKSTSSGANSGWPEDDDGGIEGDESGVELDICRN